VSTIPPPAIRPDVGRDRWVARHIGFEHDGLVLDGVDIWAGEWRPIAGPPVELPHPAYPDQLHEFSQYDVAEGPRSIRVAATELSNGRLGVLYYSTLTLYSTPSIDDLKSSILPSSSTQWEVK
jgi:hypothetical protein